MQRHCAFSGTDESGRPIPGRYGDWWGKAAPPVLGGAAWVGGLGCEGTGREEGERCRATLALGVGFRAVCGLSVWGLVWFRRLRRFAFAVFVKVVAMSGLVLHRFAVGAAL